MLAWLTLPSTANIHIDATFTSARRVLSSYIPNAWVISLYIPNARVGISKENTRGVGISQEKSRINPSMGQLMDEGGCPIVKCHCGTLSAASDGGRKSRPTIVMYVCERKSSV